MNKQEILEAIKNKVDIPIKDLKQFNNDKEVMLSAISKGRLSLKYVSDDLKNNKNFVILAVSKQGLSLEFASDVLKNDKEVV